MELRPTRMALVLQTGHSYGVNNVRFLPDSIPVLLARKFLRILVDVDPPASALVALKLLGISSEAGLTFFIQHLLQPLSSFASFTNELYDFFCRDIQLYACDV